MGLIWGHVILMWVYLQEDGVSSRLPYVLAFSTRAKAWYMQMLVPENTKAIVTPSANGSDSDIGTSDQ